jgi:serine O-acetyltransferase
MKISEFRALTQSDLFRYSGSARLKDHLYHYLLSPGYRYTWWMRFCAYSHAHPFWRNLFPFAWLVYYHLQIKYGIAISFKAKIGPGFYLGHHGGIVTNEDMRIGKNCNLSHDVTIGVSRRGERAGVPVIGDNVYIGPGAKIFGKIAIGNNAAIGANCVVTKDVPDNGVVVGIPGRVISYEGSTGYINNTNYAT